MTRIGKILIRLPFTLTMLAGLVVAAIVTNTYVETITHHWLNRTGFSPNDLWYMGFERLFTSAWVTSGGRAFWEAMLMIALIVGLAEWLTGWKRAAMTFWGIHLLVLVLLSMTMILATHTLRSIGLAADVLARDVGPSAGYFACLGLVSGRLKQPWHWLSGSVMIAALAIIMFMPVSAGESAELKFSADLAHLMAFPLGWFSSRISYSQPPRSHLESR